MKQRALLTATQVIELYEFLSRRLEAIGIESQPEIVLKLLDLSKRSDAQLKEYANVIKTDHAISGRVLKLANSAMFAQRTPVSNLERACTLLGIERLKSVSLGFHLSRAATAKDAGLKGIARKTWGQSVFRACMASQAAKVVAPGLGAEAFVIGLMMDAAVPLCAKLIGEPFLKLYVECNGPGKLYRREFEQLGFTHVDVVTVLARRWRFPELLSRPLELHHTKPAENAKDDSIGRLHRIAYVVGLLELEPVDHASPSLMNAASGGGMVTAQRMLRVTDGEMSKLVKATLEEYTILIEVFSEVAAGLVNIEELAVLVHNGLLSCLDQHLEESLGRELSGGATPTDDARQSALTIHDTRIEIVRESDGSVVAFVTDSVGKRVVSHRLLTSGDTPGNICENLGIETPTADDVTRINARLKALAA